MSQLTNKSDINIAAAYELQKQSYYCSSVHCSYYSCMQLIMHILFFKMGYNQKQLADDFYSYKKANPQSRGGLHEYYINLVATHLKNSRLDAILFNKEMYKLKKTRTDSDYSDLAIGPDESRFSIQKAEDLNKIMKKAI